MLAMTVTQGIVGTILLLCCILLILVILVQKGRGGGLAGAFGGSGGHSAFGAKTGDVFTWITVGLTFAFILMSVVANYTFRPPPIGATPVAQNQSAAPAESGEEQPAVPPAGNSASQPG